MDKIGKYSTGLGGSVKDAGSPYGQSNKGYDARTNEMSAMKRLEPRNKPTKGYVGAAKDPEMKRPKK